MNIFFVDRDPVVAARCLYDKHVVKMIVESAQLLSTAHRVIDGRDLVLSDPREALLYKATHVNHPSAKWVRAGRDNYAWLCVHTEALLAEYTYRYGREHATAIRLPALKMYPIGLSLGGTTPPCAMPEEFKISDDPVLNYRNYYVHGKAHLIRYTRREKPEWI